MPEMGQARTNAVRGNGFFLSTPLTGEARRKCSFLLQIPSGQVITRFKQGSFPWTWVAGLWQALNQKAGDRDEARLS